MTFDITNATKAIEKVASDPNKTREDFIKELDAIGYKAVYPEANEIQIDIDNEQHQSVFDRSFAILERDLNEGGKGFVKRIDTVSKSGTGKHIRLWVGWDLDPFERIALQASLGSDPVRELLSCIRLYKGDDHPTMLAEKK